MSLFGSIGRAFSGIGRAIGGVVRTALPIAQTALPLMFPGAGSIVSAGLGLLSGQSQSFPETSPGGSTGYMPDPGVAMAQRYTMNPIQTQNAYPLTSTPQEQPYLDSEEYSDEESDGLIDNGDGTYTDPDTGDVYVYE